MKKSLVGIAWLAGSAALVVLSISAINVKREGHLTGIEVNISEFDNGQYFLTEDDVREEVKAVINTPEEHMIRDFDPMELESVLRVNPFIKSANVFITTDGVLGLDVEQREPVMRVMADSGESYYLDRDGVIVPVSQHYTARVLVVSGDIDAGAWQQESADEEEMDPEVEFNNKLHEIVLAIDGDPFLKPLVEQVHVDGSKEITLIPKIGEVKVTFGSAGNYEQKIRNLKTIYQRLFKTGTLKQYETIDLSYDGQVIAKRKN